ncbi:MAG: hypothetical protein ABI162_15720 [Luteolibacter sp.]
MNTYKSEVEAINQSITTFNKCLAGSCLIPEIDTFSGIEEKNIVEILHRRWDDFPFPNSDSRGVYFIFGRHREQQARNGVYIGKASFGSAIGRRLYSWLHPHRSSEHFIMNYGQDTYILDYIASISLDKLAIPFMASALEEYLISSLSSRLNLLNGTGNSRRA